MSRVLEVVVMAVVMACDSSDVMSFPSVHVSVVDLPRVLTAMVPLYVCESKLASVHSRS